MKVNLKNIHSVFFIGIGGIGMSAIARYFYAIGKTVAGYDKTQTVLTSKLENEGIKVHFDDNINNIETYFTNKENALIVYTPAISSTNKELNYFIDNDFTLVKRAEILGIITNSLESIAVAGTHGKTSISTITAHLIHNSKIKCSAFLGGISKNFNSNLVTSKESEVVVVEADEFDRSFLQLYPKIAVISSMDADHLDIYGNENELKRSFTEFASQIKKDGYLLIKNGLEIELSNDIKKYTYSVNSKADFMAENIRYENNRQIFDLITPFGKIENLELGIPGIINIENSVVAIAASLLSGVSADEIQKSLPNFKGVKRRFDYIINKSNLVYIDDYAHHPEELRATILSVQKLYPDKKITGIFQPHLFSRTKDFYIDFAKSLDLLDEIILLDIYPAREKPIKAVTSKIIFDEIENKNKILCIKENLIEVLSNTKIEILLTLGAGDIDTKVNEIKQLLEK